MTYRVVVFGEGGVGKTAVTIRFCMENFVDVYDPTIEDSYRKAVSVDDQECVLEIIDTAGQEDYSALREQWIKDGHAFLVVFSVQELSTFMNVNKFCQHIERIKKPGECPIIIVGNKADIPERQREVKYEAALSYAKSKGFEYIEVSAKNNVNIQRTFHQIIRELRRKQSKNEKHSGKFCC
ncbi:LET-60 RAS, long isoform [Rozella allomycis CSF55]|uniref:LET-60 RAS, long isoform n=1 Tax=Rozella allomycis (strain CSF55) TaxID=988480 RepID=A0A075APT6_ROZAC|nr:Small GTPase superfamily domain-containing protein [Rozella allomycis CSF55]RKP18618.1 LET-60 RAS, long isoform [Rozella allomycis CSF55]|eukprot:EPZ30755.1 Small GTPase superfamily domain-containing protein [Rozella allomycis CSF55]